MNQVDEGKSADNATRVPPSRNVVSQEMAEITDRRWRRWRRVYGCRLTCAGDESTNRHDSPDKKRAIRA
jgi:hypothetical protein